jgi:hypothetical protein
MGTIGWVLFVGLFPWYTFMSFWYTISSYGISIIGWLLLTCILIRYCIKTDDKKVGREAFDDKNILTPKRWEECMEVILRDVED